MAAPSFTITVTAAPVSPSRGAARVKFSRPQFRPSSARVPRVGFGVTPKQSFLNQFLHETGRFMSKACERKVREPEDRFASTETPWAILPQRNALKRADDVVGAFLGEEAF